MHGYFLNGIDNDNILVFRSADEEELLLILRRLCASRHKEIRALAEKLEEEWNDKQNGNRAISCHTKPDNGKKGKARTRSRNGQISGRK